MTTYLKLPNWLEYISEHTISFLIQLLHIHEWSINNMKTLFICKISTYNIILQHKEITSWTWIKIDLHQ